VGWLKRLRDGTSCISFVEFDPVFAPGARRTLAGALWSLKNKRNQIDMARVVYSRGFSLKTRE
jgi:hypothetical protein